MITLQRINHREQDRILLKLLTRMTPEAFLGYTAKIKQVTGWTYSKTFQGYHVPYSRAAFNQLENIFGPENLSYEKNDTKEKNEAKTPMPLSRMSKATAQIEKPNISKMVLPEKRLESVTEDKKVIVPDSTKNSLPIVSLRPVFVNKQERILFCGDYPRRLDNLLLKTVPGARYSDNLKGWHVPLNEAVYHIIKEKTAGVAVLEVATLKHYLERRRIVEKTAPVPVSPQTTAERTILMGNISIENLQQTERLVQQLILEGLSINTINSYRSEFIQFTKWLGKKDATTVNNEDLRNFMLYSLGEQKISENTAHSRINALKAYYEKVLKNAKFYFQVPRPKKHKRLPKILSEKELGRLFNGVTNLKHKAILFTAYSSGLRVSETCALRLQDIDRDRMQLFIHKGKGNKDRMVPLSPVVSDVLQKYLELEKVKPLKYVFEGDIPGTSITKSTAQKTFHNAKEGSDILKSVSFHSLRHLFATHMLEKGVSTRYIQEILGHFDIKTTELYLHVAKTMLVNLPSPMDDLWQKGGIEF